MNVFLAHHVHAMFMEAKSEAGFWNWSSRELWAAVWMLGIGPPSGRAVMLLNNRTMSPVPGLYTLTRENLDVGCYHFVLKARWNVFLSHYSCISSTLSLTISIYFKPWSQPAAQPCSAYLSDPFRRVPQQLWWFFYHLLHLRLRALGSLLAFLLVLCPSSTALKQSPNSHPAEFWINRGLLLYALKIFVWIKLSFPIFLF